MRRGSLVLLVGVLAGSAHATILIDDFTSGFASGSSSTDFFYHTASPNSLGGFRAVNHTFSANPLNRPVLTDVNSFVPGNMFIESGSGVSSLVLVAWGGAPVGPTSGPGQFTTGSFAGLGGMDLSGETGIQINYINNDQASTQFAIQIYDTFANGPVSAFVNAAPGNGSVFISFASLGGFVDLTQVELVTVGALLPNGNDVTLTNVSAVPEPATMTVLGLGIAALAARKRRK